MEANQKKRILVVEDERDTRYILKKIFIKNGYEAEEASNGKEALELLNQMSFDLVLADWTMPVMDGIELIENVRKTEGIRDIPIIIFSARASRHDCLKGLFSGANDYLIKPVENKVLMERIKLNITDRGKLYKRIGIEPEFDKWVISKLEDFGEKMISKYPNANIKMTVEQENTCLKWVIDPGDCAGSILDEEYDKYFLNSKGCIHKNI